MFYQKVKKVDFALQTSAAPKKESVKQARRGLYQQLLIDSGEKVFASLGYNAAKVQDIAANAGLSLGTFYSVFDGKDELFNAVHETRGLAVSELSRQVVDPNQSAVENLFLGVAAYVQFFVEHPHYLRMHINEGTTWALESGLETPAQMEVWREGLGLLAQILEQGMAEGDVIQEDPAILAKILSASHQVRLADWLEQEPQDSAGQLTCRIHTFMAKAYLTPSGKQKISKFTTN